MQQNNDITTSVMPDAESKLNKKAQVADMFNKIAGNYDFLNHFLSLGIDRLWRKRAIAAMAAVNPAIILDVATGTGDMAIEASKLKPQKIIGVDIATQMLEIGREKIAKKNLSNIISLEKGDSESLWFDDNTFNAITCAYGVRNFENVTNGLSEMYRVMKPGGKLCILEFSKPVRFPVRQLYMFYFKAILPFLGKMFSKDDRAYTYLPASVMAFPEGRKFCDMLEQCGFKNARYMPLTGGITTLYTADK